MGRLELQSLLEVALGAQEVYFQPPANISMQYPCIVYALDDANTDFADDRPYHVAKRYTVTVMSRDPDDSTVDRVAALSTSILNRTYTANNLHHTVFLLYA